MSDITERAPASPASAVLRAAAVSLSAVIYVFFLATFFYAIGFIADLPMLPKVIDSGHGAAPLQAALINIGLLGQFGLQHSVMARLAFKRWWTKIVPDWFERSAFVLAATVSLALVLWLWQPMPATVWRVGDPQIAGALWALYAVGWGVLLLSTFPINHFELFGLQQALGNLLGRTFEPPTFRTPLFYRYVRHPLYLGFIIAFWAAPEMSQGRLLFAIVCTAYILVGIFFEERDLVAHFGDKYRAYQKRVPMLLPGPRKAE